MSHDHQNSKKNQIRIRISIIRYAQKHGIKPATKRFGCSKNTVKLWLRRYKKQVTSGLLNLHKSKPYSS
ncbi:MAG: helix-turn-helix domain-containing protein [Parachlamydiales bacterium]|nr:helix-turn-helix domain-containing protein [Parachlamydiales bacterium]